MKQVIRQRANSLFQNDDGSDDMGRAHLSVVLSWRIVNWILLVSQYGLHRWTRNEWFAGKMRRRQKERALTSPKTSALAFISVLPWRINDGQILLGSSFG